MEDNKDLLALLRYLLSKKIVATISEMRSMDESGLEKILPAIKLANHDIDTILFDERKELYDIKRIKLTFTVVVDRPLTDIEKTEIYTVTDVARQRSILDKAFLRSSLENGKVVDVKWSGGRIADILNEDVDLARMLQDYAAYYRGSLFIMISVSDDHNIDIVSPALGSSFTTSAEIEARGDTEKYWHHVVESLDEHVRFEIYERIAKNIKDILSRGLLS